MMDDQASAEKKWVDENMEQRIAGPIVISGTCLSGNHRYCQSGLPGSLACSRDCRLCRQVLICTAKTLSRTLGEADDVSNPAIWADMADRQLAAVGSGPSRRRAGAEQADWESGYVEVGLPDGSPSPAASF
jgi:hypothetical protein